METPSSSRRITRSQAMSRKIEESEKVFTKSKVLYDITNDSPIVGVAMGNFESPSSKFSRKKNINCIDKQSPGSGEALLRDQVKNLLQKVQEDEKFIVPILPLSTINETNAEQIRISEMVNDIFEEKKHESVEHRDSVITRTLFLDFCDNKALDSEKLSEDDDDSSVWSVQVNASTTCAELIDEFYIEKGERDEFNVHELCERMKGISVNGVKFKGKHTRFVYNSDDELQEEVDEENENLDSGILKLKGLPTPKGKHLRFFEEEEDKVEF